MIFFSSPSTDPCQEQNRTSDPKILLCPVDGLDTSLLPFYATQVALKDLVFSTPYFPMGGGMASVISKYLPTVEATAEVTSASVDNCLLVGAKKADIAFTMADVGWDALQGKGKRVSTGAPGSGTEVKALRVLEAYGLDPDKDMTRDRLGASESAGAFKDKKIDKALP